MEGKYNRVKACRLAGGTAVGTWVQIAAPEIVEAAGYQGFDFVIIDMEHGHFGFDTAHQMVRAADAAGVAPVVRVPALDESAILKVLDMGAMGVLVPGVSTRQDAERAVRAAKYAPWGTRGACPWTRATGYETADWQRHAEWSNAETMVWLLVEGTAGVDNFDDILAVPHVDALMMGPFDLSQSLGVAGQLEHPRLSAALATMAEKAAARGVDMVAVMLSERSRQEIGAAVGKWRGLGCRIMTVGGDRSIVAGGFRATLASARQALE